ncbi:MULTISPECIES: nucleoside 2-deoxyribosyltransferase domain-containing protein [Flavobacterium]|uniref:Nucleoside 2-deoxyribosyltransferase-like protein n=1 Tax=Flavobacterium cutihirudinis TaxID=1265740 RepID=A0A3D9G1D2_9FLAO|nr:MULTISPECIES: nucleoside 2-deoxyribosyltransferase domain-containing protein [Flavobacterium]MBZ4040946.1 nucleoside 2-deoxyribosyltransferase domain-containing protein [Flavobacterium hibisci]RED27010.1 nucleoside 2-deoxyribosyltransferase-like protein [Flavobacterium cutihirudinis]
MKTKVYLAGGMNESNWQKKVIETINSENFVFYNPREHELTNSAEYTFWDLFYVKQSDILFAYMQNDNPSGIGLTLEVGYARALDKSIILIDERSKNDEIFANRFKIVRESSTIVFDNLEEGINFLKKIKNGIINV